MRNNLKIFERLTHISSYCILIITIFLVLIAFFAENKTNVPSLGSFETYEFNDNWTLKYGDEISTVSLPCKVDVDDGEIVTLSNTLPDDISNGMTLMSKSSMQDVRVYVNGELREEYSSATVIPKIYYLSSSYYVVKLYSRDAGKTIKIRTQIKSQNTLNSVQIGYGNNVWYNVIERNLTVDIFATIILAMGISIAIITIILRNIPDNAFPNTKPILYLGLLMIDLSIWIFSESEMKPLIFNQPSLAQFFCYTSIETLIIYILMYINELTKRRHNTLYLCLELGALTTFIINSVLQFTGIKDYFATLPFAHAWIILSIIFFIYSFIRDIISHTIKEYFITFIGIVFFILMGAVELIAFYTGWVHAFGAYLCIGLLALMITTIIELLIHEMKQSREQDFEQTKTIVNTIETIASAIDARDKYTGGHSERVAQYAGLLAREMAADYDFTEEDILRITYVGLMHDIGKIGVADPVLNKSGKLTDEEYSLMKKHPEIGYELLSPMDNSIEGLLDGVRHHHERFDGKGYPDGLSDTDIPLIARILCLADCYDAMTSNRVYRKRLSDEEVRNEFVRCSGTQFDPSLTEIFINLMDEGKLRPDTYEGMATSKDGTVPASSLLENNLQQLLLDKEAKVPNPTHVRMLCYVIKLMEKKGQVVEIFIVGNKTNKNITDCKNSDGDTLESILKSKITGRDIYISYTSDSIIVALFENSPDEISAIRTAIESTGCYFEPIENKK